jgi:hypothetical protein
MSMKSEYVEFPVPAGYELPEGVNTGEDFDTVATFRMKEDGTICLISIDDFPVQGETETIEENTEPKDKRGIADALRAKAYPQAG